MVRRCWKGKDLFFEIDLTSGYITEIVAQRSGDLQIENFMRPSARLLICATWLPEAHEFDTPDVNQCQLFSTNYRNFFLSQLASSQLQLHQLKFSEAAKKTFSCSQHLKAAAFAQVTFPVFGFTNFLLLVAAPCQLNVESKTPIGDHC